MPIYQLLGGKCHESLRCYASTGSPAYPLEKALDYFADLVSRGYTGIKTIHGYAGRPGPETLPGLLKQERAKFSAMREGLGDDVDLMLDPAAPFNRRPWSVDTAVKVISALEEFDLLWVEQPVLQTNVEDYVRIRQCCSTPLAAGENATTLHDIKPFLERRAIDICQPDAAWCGGIGQFMKIVAAAEAHDMRIAPHCFSGAVGLAANYHAAFACESCFIVEFPTAENALVAELFGGAFEFDHGMIRPTGAPGLGLHLSDDLIDRFRFAPGSGLSHARSPFPRPIPNRWRPSGDESPAW